MSIQQGILNQIRIRRASGPKRKPKKAARPRHPYSIEREYRRILVAYVKRYADLVKKILIPSLPNLVRQAKSLRPDSKDIHADDWVTDLAELLNAITFQFNKDVQTTQVSIDTIARKVNKFNEEDIQRVIRSVVGVDVFLNEPWLKQNLDWFNQQNRTLIKDLPTKATRDIEILAQKGLANGDTAEVIGRQIQKQFGIAQRRAELIARDQVASFNGTLTQLRQREAGVTEYIWRTSLDERVRPEHEAREGETFKWSDPPDDGHPGQPINCFPGNTKFNPFDSVRKFFSYSYAGNLVTLVCDGGKSIKATPNHPILTTKGYMPIGEIKIGEYIVGVSKSALQPTRVNYGAQDFASAFEQSAKVFGVTSKMSDGKDFHGDCQADLTIDIIDVERTGGEVEPLFLENLIKTIYRVNEIKVSTWYGKVYNAETEGGFYGVESGDAYIIASNCRCVAEPVLDKLLEQI